MGWICCFFPPGAELQLIYIQSYLLFKAWVNFTGCDLSLVRIYWEWTVRTSTFRKDKFTQLRLIHERQIIAVCSVQFIGNTCLQWLRGRWGWISCSPPITSSVSPLVLDNGAIPLILSSHPPGFLKQTSCFSLLIFTGKVQLWCYFNLIPINVLLLTVNDFFFIIHLTCRRYYFPRTNEQFKKKVLLLFILLFLWWVSVCFDSCILPSNTGHTGDFKPAASSMFSLLFSHPKRPDLPGDGSPASQMPWQLSPKACHPVATGCQVESTAGTGGHVIRDWFKSHNNSRGAEPPSRTRNSRKTVLKINSFMIEKGGYHNSWMSFTVLRKRGIDT